MVNTILIAVTLIVLAIFLATFIRSSKQQEKRIDLAKIETMTAVERTFEAELKKIAKAYAEEAKLIQRIEDLSKKGELNAEDISESTNLRAFALAVSKAEEAVKLSEGDLATVRAKISKMKREIINGQSLGYAMTSIRESLEKLQAEEKKNREELIKRRRELYDLTGTLSAVPNTQK